MPSALLDRPPNFRTHIRRDLGRARREDRLTPEAVLVDVVEPAPMVGGMISSTLLTLVVIPAVYSLWKEYSIRRSAVVAID